MKCRLFEGNAPLKGQLRDVQVLGTIAFPGMASLEVDRKTGKEVRIEGKGTAVEPAQKKDDEGMVVDAIYDLNDDQISHCARLESPYRVVPVKEEKKSKKEPKE
jgi:hypothetical protein